MSTLTFGSNQSNPIIEKLKENPLLKDNSEVATYAGVAKKTGMFLGCTCLGTLFFFLLHNFMASSAVFSFEAAKGILQFNLSIPEIVIIVVSTLITCITPFVTWFARKSIPVLGTVYTLAEGCTIGAILTSLAPGFQHFGILAFLITALIVVSMLMVYSTGKIHFPSRTKRFVIASFIACVLVALVGGILTAIPFTRPFMMAVSPMISIGFSFISILFSAFFLLVDFETIQNYVENGMPKECEWTAAWGLSYAIIYLFVRVLSLLIKLAAKKR